MNAPLTQTKKASTTDSLFGMALAQAFTGLAFGMEASTIWEAGEMASAIRDDRFAAKTASKGTESTSYKLGVKNSLARAFSCVQDTTRQTLAELDRATFRPTYANAYALPSLG